MNNVSVLLLSRINPGETAINITTDTTNVTLHKNFPDQLFAKPLSQGDAQCTLPSDWCSAAPNTKNCSSNQQISAKVKFVQYQILAGHILILKYYQLINVLVMSYPYKLANLFYLTQ